MSAGWPADDRFDYLCIDVTCTLTASAGVDPTALTPAAAPAPSPEAIRDGTRSHFVTHRPSDPGIQRPGDPVDPVIFFL